MRLQQQQTQRIYLASKKNNIPIRKKWGQNFLIDMNIVNNIINIIEPSKNDKILEIGPGKGAVTIPLSNKVNLIHGIEIDPMLYNYLMIKNIKNIKLTNIDILKWDDSKISNFNKIIGNIPYNISSQIIFKFIRNPNFESMIFMIQKELAQRIVSRHGNKLYGRISVMIQTFCNVEIKLNISKNVFFPKPKVNSSVIKISPDKTTINFDNYSQLIKESFKQRRKKLKNNLKNLCDVSLLGNYADKRPEEISVENYKLLYKKIYI